MSPVALPAVALPAVGWRPARPRILDTVSVARAGNRAISFVETADPVWTIDMTTMRLTAAEAQAMEGFAAQVRHGLRSVLWRPVHACLPQAYWGNASHAHLADPGALVSVEDGHMVTVAVADGLTITTGDLFSIAHGGCRALCRAAETAIASGGDITLRVEPYVPLYVATAGAIVRFASPEIAMRMVPGSFTMPDDPQPQASFSLIEVPR